MVIAAAQFEGSNDFKANLAAHEKLILEAAQNKVDLILFPEMSLTGYCREEGQSLAFAMNDKRLSSLQKLAKQTNIILIIGAPILIKTALYIGAFIIQPNHSLKVYTKQYLHDGEALFYSSSFNYNPILNLKGEKISLAICADIDHPQHQKQACLNKSSLYLPGIFFSKGGIQKGHDLLCEAAQKYNMPILMSNFTGKHWNLEAGGRSAFWDQYGNLVAELGTQDTGLLIAQKINTDWSTRLMVL